MASCDFTYHKPSTATEAAALLASLDDGRLLAGGQSLLPQLFSRRLRCAAVVDISSVDELAAIREEASTVVAGATCRQRRLEGSACVRAANPMLTAVLSHLGPAAVRGRATIGGNLALADPASELLAIAMAQDWRLRLQSAARIREVAATAFVTRPYVTVLRHGELIHSVAIPNTAEQGWSVETVRVSRTARPLAGVAICATLQGSRISRAAIVAFAVGEAPHRLRAVEADITGQAVSEPLLEAAAHEVSNAIEVRGDAGVTAAWRRRAAGALTRRALAKAVGSARVKQHAYV
jgi:carbon-monoxide dehydrogenase medium subunit